MIVDVCDKEWYDGKFEFIDLIVGYIFKVINILFLENLDENGLFFKLDELRKKYELIFGKIKIENIVVYCGLGVMVCYILLVLDYVEMEILNLYVGLWSEWSRNNKKIEKMNV